MPDWIPGPDDEFDPLLTQFNGWVQANGEAHGLTPANLSALNTATTNWGTAFAANATAQTAAATALAAKDAARAAAEALVRALARILQADPTLTDADRTAAGLTVRETGRTRAAVPTTRPIAMVDTRQRLRHTINFKDETTPNSKKKPDGVMGVEIWCALGPNPPADASACTFVALDTNTPYVVDYDGSDANKVAHYLLRWVNTRGEKGPWSETVSATIGA